MPTPEQHTTAPHEAHSTPDTPPAPATPATPATPGSLRESLVAVRSALHEVQSLLQDDDQSLPAVAERLERAQVAVQAALKAALKAHDDLGLVEVEYGIEVTWRDWQKAGARGPTSFFGALSSPDQVEKMLHHFRMDADIVATRVLQRETLLGPWEGPEVPTTIGDAEREALKIAHWQTIMAPRNPPAGPATPDTP